MTADSKAWGLREWNLALVEAVFLNRSRPRKTLSRIDTTGRLFEVVTGEKDRESAKRRFIASFGRDPAAIREQFTWSQRIEVLTKRDGIPPTFAALYLSLLAASAEDYTFAEGNFRKRFAALLQLGDGQSFDFEQLPRLWAHLASWTQIRSTKSGGCAILVLPDPQSETRIGHSKRLAFPTFRDERQLRQVLVDSKLDGASTFASVDSAIYRNISAFSASFREEVEEFHSLVSKARDQEAFDSPFWGAIRDITWEEEDERARTDGRFCLQLDLVDPQSPALFLLVDEVGAKGIGEQEMHGLGRARGEYSYFFKGRGAHLSISELLSLANRHAGFAKSKVGKSLRAGGLGLFPDDLGNMASDGEYRNEGPAVFILSPGNASALVRTSAHLNLTPVQLEGRAVLGNWEGFAYPRLSRYGFERVVASMPDLEGVLACKGWRPPHPSIAGGARYGQAVLLNPASNPVVRLDGATGGRFELVGATQAVIASGDLAKHEGGGFYIPPEKLVGLIGVTTCRYVLDVETSAAVGRESILEVPALSTVPSGELQPLQWDDWLVEGCEGVLEGAGFLAPPGRQRACGEPAGSLIPMGRHWPLFEMVGDDRFASCTNEALDALPLPLEWLAEALSLRYQRRATLPFGELGMHVGMAAKASETTDWRLRRLMFAANWIQAVERRTAPHATVVPAVRTISHSAKGTQVLARVVGMLTRHDQHVMLGKLSSGESATRVVAADAGMSVGCIELRLASVKRVAEIAAVLGLAIVDRNAIGNPLGGLLHPTTKAELVTRPAVGLEIEAWDPRSGTWIADTTSGEGGVLGALFRSNGRQRTTYWVKSSAGYVKTDSRPWASLLGRTQARLPLGRLAMNGDASWSGALRSLPTYLCWWWLHWGGGCIAIAADGGIVFCGGPGRQIWEGVARPSSALTVTNLVADPAISRRSIALQLRRRARAGH